MNSYTLVANIVPETSRFKGPLVEERKVSWNRTAISIRVTGL